MCYVRSPGLFIPRLQKYLNHELPDVQAGFRKGRGTRDQIANIHWIIEKAREFQRNKYSCFIDYTNAFGCVDHSKLKKSLRNGNTKPPVSASWKICMQIKKQQLEPDMEQWTGSKLGKEYVKVTLLIELTCRVHHAKCWAGWSTNWNQDFLGEISITSDMQMTPPLWQKVRRN